MTTKKNYLTKEIYYTWRRKALDPLDWYLSRKEIRQTIQSADKEKLLEKANRFKGRGYYASIHAVQNQEKVLKLIN